MDRTPNYGLQLTEDASTKFIDWRKAMNGNTDSNMTKIDAVLGGKADSSVSVSGVLLASAWVGDAAPYTQEIAIEGLGADQNGIISVSPDATVDQWFAVRNAGLSVIGQSEGTLLVAAEDEVKPTVDIPVTVILLG